MTPKTGRVTNRQENQFAFLLGALSIIGLPPFGGSWSKWYLALGALEAGQLALVGVLMVSSLLNVAYLLPIPARGFFLPPEDGATGLREAPLLCVVPLCLTAAACIVLFFAPEAVTSLLEPILPDATPDGLAVDLGDGR